MSSENVWDFLRRNGWVIKKDTQTPSLVTFEHPNIKGEISIPLGKKEIPESTLKEIFKKAGLL